MAKRIRRARKDMGLSQERFAQAVGVGRRAPIRWESGEVQPQARHLARIVQVSGKDIEFFFSEDDDEESELMALRRRAEALASAAGDVRSLADDLLREVEHMRDQAEVEA